MQPLTEMTYNYLDLVKGFAPVILLEVSDDDYQGDTRLLLRDAEGRWGYLRFGWGSCSGCDSLQACDSLPELSDLRDELARGVHWEADPYALAYWLAHRDWDAYEGGATVFFVTRALEILAEHHQQTLHHTFTRELGDR